jgi:leader peptidase (prepilin peptidase)/N-methyltransferase
MVAAGMDVPLVVGCGLGGIAVGAAVSQFAVRVRPAPPAGAEVPEPVHAGPSGAVHAPVRAPQPSAPPQTAVAPVVSLPASPRFVVAVRVAAAVVTGALVAAAADHFGAEPALAPYAVLFTGLVALSVVDLRVGLIPRTLLYPLSALVAVALLAASIATGRMHAVGDAAIGSAISFGVFFAIWWIYPRGIGFGDVRLAGLIGLGLGWLGLLHVYVGFLVGLVAGAVFGVALMAARGVGRKTRMPFAPALAVGAVVAVLWGSQIINAWLPGHA